MTKNHLLKMALSKAMATNVLTGIGYLNYCLFHSFIPPMFLKLIGVTVQFALSNTFFLGLLGLINRLTGRALFSSVFLAYPANEAMVKKFSFKWVRPFFRLRPATLGFFMSNKRITLVMSIGSVEKEIFKFTKDELALLDARLAKVQRLLGAKYRTMAGIVPSMMQRAGVEEQTSQLGATVHIVCKVIRDVVGKENLPKNATVVIVGSNGHIGSGICKELNEDSEETRLKVISLDRSDDVASVLKGIEGRHLVVNVASYSAWTRIMDGLTADAVVLNEVYPPPHGSVKAVLKKRWTLYHLSGVKTDFNFPKLGDGYGTVMPCCAATGDSAFWVPVSVQL